VDQDPEFRLRWKPSFRAWLVTTLAGLSILALACWRYPSLRVDWVSLVLSIPFMTTSMFIGLRIGEKAFRRPTSDTAERADRLAALFFLLIYRKHSPKWADHLFFVGCFLIYLTAFLYFFGMPDGVLWFAIDLVASFIPCMLWNFLVLILVAAVDFYSGATPEIHDEKTWLLRQVRNLY